MNNKDIFQTFMKLENAPRKAEERYIFILDNRELGKNIFIAEYRQVVLQKNDENFFTVDSFIEYVDGLQLNGTALTDYTFIIACRVWETQDKIEKFFKNNEIKYKSGSHLFKNKEYLENFDYVEKLKEVLYGYIQRLEPENLPPDKEKFHHINNDGKPTGPFDFAIREDIKERYALFICGCPYVYSDGVYIADYRGTKLREIIESYLYDNFKTIRYINQIYNLILNDNSLQREFENTNCYPAHYIFFQDCILDAKTLRELPHSPEYFCVNMIPHKWEEVKKTANGEEIEKFFNFIFTSADDKKMFLEYAGLCMTKDVSQQRFLVLCGVGGTGKSLLIRLIEKMLGSENVSNVALQDLSRRFSTSLLVGMLMNSCADLPPDSLEDSSVMKKLLGEDTIFCERKGEQGFSFKNYAKLLFSTNQLPTIQGERTNGFYRRLLILQMNKRPGKVDVELFPKLENEILYFIELCVKALHEMYSRNGVITISKNSSEAVRQMWQDSDVVQAWLDNNCTIDESAELDRTKLYEDFEKYCQAEGRQSLTKNGFYKALRGKNFRESRGKSERKFVGISVGKVTQNNEKSDTFMETFQEQIDSLPFV